LVGFFVFGMMGRFSEYHK